MNIKKLIIKKKVFLILLAVIIIPLIVPVSLIYFSKINNNCIKGPFIFPKIYSLESSFDFRKEYASTFLSKEICFFSKELLEEKKSYEVSISFFNIFKKEFQFQTESHPILSKTPDKTEFHIKENIQFELDKSSEIFNYYIKTKNDNVKCSQTETLIECELEKLNLKQGKEYILEIYSVFENEKIQDLGKIVIKTPEPILVTNTSIKDSSSINYEIDEIKIWFNKDIKDLEISVENKIGEGIPFKFNIEDNVILIKTTNPITFETNVRIALTNIRGFDESFLEGEYFLDFSVTKKDWWEYPDDIEYTKKSGDDLLVVVSKKYKLPSTYIPNDLVNINKANIKTDKEILIREIVINDLKRLGEDAKKDNIDLTITSGYRSYETQKITYQHWLNINQGNIAVTDQISARPGHSEHQLGTTIDFSTNTGGFGGFTGTPAANWLEENAHKYGFVLSYPKNSEPITGFIYESWHYRYTGFENARKIKESGLIPLQWFLRQ